LRSGSSSGKTCPKFGGFFRHGALNGRFSDARPAGRNLMGMTRELRAAAGIAAILAGGLVLSGCIGGPTYGTDKTAGEHLLDDLGSAVSLAPAKKDPVKYQPRPGLVLPPQQQQTALVEPQQSLASREANPAWVESPEETRARLREEADANKNDPNYVSPLAKRMPTAAVFPPRSSRRPIARRARSNRAPMRTSAAS
jgi:hypothetical protein